MSRRQRFVASHACTLAVMGTVALVAYCPAIEPRMWTKGTAEEAALFSAHCSETNSLTIKLVWESSTTNVCFRRLRESEVQSIGRALAHVDQESRLSDSYEAEIIEADLFLTRHGEGDEALRVGISKDDRIFLFEEQEHSQGPRILCFRSPGVSSVVLKMKQQPGATVKERPKPIYPDPPRRIQRPQRVTPKDPKGSEKPFE